MSCLLLSSEHDSYKTVKDRGLQTSQQPCVGLTFAPTASSVSIWLVSPIWRGRAVTMTCLWLDPLCPQPLPLHPDVENELPVSGSYEAFCLAMYDPKGCTDVPSLSVFHVGLMKVSFARLLWYPPVQASHSTLIHRPSILNLKS